MDMATIPLIAPMQQATRDSSDIMHLWRHVSSHELAARADRRRHMLFAPNVVTLTRDGPICFSNLCDGCDDHDGHVAPDDRAGFILTPDEAAAQAAIVASWDATRVTLRGGVWDGLPLDAMEAIARAVVVAAPDAFIDGLTPTQIALMARASSSTIAAALDRLHHAGLRGICGDDLIRVTRGAGMLSWDGWRDILRQARRLGMEVSVGIVVRPEDSYAALTEMMERVSDLADLGLTSIVCRAMPGADGARDGRRFLKLVALARLIAHAGTHISVERVGAGLPLAALALTAGADDVAGTWEPGRDASSALTEVRQRRLANEAEATIRDLGFAIK